MVFSGTVISVLEIAIETFAYVGTLTSQLNGFVVIGDHVKYNEILGKGACKTLYGAFDEYEGIEVAWNQAKLYDFDLELAEVVASLTSTGRFLFNAKFEPIIQNGHVLIQGSISVTFLQSSMLQQDEELDKSGIWILSIEIFLMVPDWERDKNRGTTVDASNKHIF